MMMWPLCVSNISKGKLEFVDKKFKLVHSASVKSNEKLYFCTFTLKQSDNIVTY